MHAWRRSVLLIGVTAIGLGGCAHATGGGAAHRAKAIDRNFCPRSSATVYVTNDNWLDLVIYAVRGSTKYRLGEVTGIQSAVFQVPEALMNSGSFAIFADPIGSFDDGTGREYGFNTGDIPLQPGHTVVDLRVANIISQSSFSYGLELPAEIS